MAVSQTVTETDLYHWGSTKESVSNALPPSPSRIYIQKAATADQDIMPADIMPAALDRYAGSDPNETEPARLRTILTR